MTSALAKKQLTTPGVASDMLEALEEVLDLVGRGGWGEMGSGPTPSKGVPWGDPRGEPLGEDGKDVLAGGPDHDTHLDR